MGLMQFMEWEEGRTGTQAGDSKLQGLGFSPRSKIWWLWASPSSSLLPHSFISNWVCWNKHDLRFVPGLMWYVF